MTRSEENFGHWLAGFIAGEGCFGIYKRNDSAGWITRFFIKLRDDDAPILLECQKVVGGTIRYITEEKAEWGNQVIWTVNSREDLQNLILILDKCPIRAKKAQDYILWREAALLRFDASVLVGNNQAKAENYPIWKRIAEIKQELTQLRKYVK